MSSLKAYLEPLGTIVGATPAALYERQRACVRLGMLPKPIKGRGHGLAATPETVAKLLLAMLGTDNLSETDDRVQRLAKARSKTRCALTGKTTFVDAVEAILQSEELAARVSAIEVNRQVMAATIRFDDAVSRFGRTPRDTGMNLQVTAKLPGFGVEVIAHDLAQIAAGEPLSQHIPFKSLPK